MAFKNQANIKTLIAGFLVATTAVSLTIRDGSKETTVMFGETKISLAAFNAYHYCQPSYPDPDTYTALPNSKLVYVQAIVRHGNRSPSLNFPNNNVTWYDCGSSLNRLYENKVNNDDDSVTMVQNIYGLTPGSNDYGSSLWEGNCYTGQLTDSGKKQLYDLGSAIRKVYVDKLGYLSKNLAKNNSDSIYVRTTYAPRTTDSAINLVSGLYPSQYREKGVTVNTGYFPIEVDNSFFNSGPCPNINVLFSKIKSSQQYMEFFNSTLPDLNRFMNILGVSPTNSAFNSDWGNSVDIATSTMCANKPLPCNSTGSCITTDDVSISLANLYQQFIYQKRDNNLVLDLLSIGLTPILKNYISNINAAIQTDKKNPNFDSCKNSSVGTKFAIHSAHDETIINLLAVLNASNEDMLPPPFASNVLTEVWRDLSTGEYKVRILYNNRVINVGPARKKGNTDTVVISQTQATDTNPAWCDFNNCSLDTYLAYLSQYITSDLYKLCH
ncbi:hypothetical protein BB558_003587 [Smittium angustum]|uniref:Acid phosphatase n=1 Tax=Smittium angustum TaxID=133377 RepID=A0A2U1J5Q2_SMIAN|nr:hypothetical protein BB558_003587 [Smittium angustum]